MDSDEAEVFDGLKWLDECIRNQRAAVNHNGDWADAALDEAKKAQHLLARSQQRLDELIRLREAVQRVWTTPAPTPDEGALPAHQQQEPSGQESIQQEDKADHFAPSGGVIECHDTVTDLAVHGDRLVATLENGMTQIIGEKQFSPDPNIPPGFTKWEGGECPVAYGTPIEVIYRVGSRVRCQAGDSYSYRWTFSRDIIDHAPEHDIIAYRIIAARSEASGTPAGEDGHLAHSPEATDDSSTAGSVDPSAGFGGGPNQGERSWEPSPGAAQSDPDPIPVNMPFERLPQHAGDPGTGDPRDYWPPPPKPKVQSLFQKPEAAGSPADEGTAEGEPERDVMRIGTQTAFEAEADRAISQKLEDVS